MDIEVRYFAGCPKWRTAVERLHQALKAAGYADVPVHLRPIETQEEAQALGFPGSPTIHIGGRDPFPSAAGIYGLTCRVYATPDGFEGAPTADQLTQALLDSLPA